MLLSEAVKEIEAPNPDYVTNILKNAPQARKDIEEFNEYIRGYEGRLQEFRAIWPDQRDEALDIALHEPFGQIDHLIAHFFSQEAEVARQLVNVRKWLSQHQLMPAFASPMHRWEEYLIAACETQRDIRWDLMMIRASRPTTKSPLQVTSVGDLRRLSVKPRD